MNNEVIRSTDMEQKTTSQILLERGRREGMDIGLALGRSALLKLAQHRLSKEELKELEEIEDLELLVAALAELLQLK